jgi:hypothetical protein
MALDPRCARGVYSALTGSIAYIIVAGKSPNAGRTLYRILVAPTTRFARFCNAEYNGEVDLRRAPMREGDVAPMTLK